MADDKSYIIDPLTSLCKVAILHFLPEGTKLAINHHTLSVQRYSYAQWMERFKNGDSRYDLSYLETPFLKAIKWYILDTDEKAEMDEELSNNIRIITTFAVKGLEKLQKNTYHNDRGVKITLQYFINLFRDALSGSWNEDNVVKMDYDNSILSEKIKNNFEPQIINSIAQTLTDADKMGKSIEDINALVDCSHNLLINRDNVFVKLMKDINTTL